MLEVDVVIWAVSEEVGELYIDEFPFGEVFFVKDGGVGRDFLVFLEDKLFI